MAVESFGPTCPWYELHQRFPPNIDWCEAKLCAWVVTPFNSWTNLAYLAAAVLMWRATRRSGDAVLHAFAPVTVFTAVTSFVYHQSLNAWSQLLDFAGMFAFCLLLLMAMLQQLGRWPAGAPGWQLYAAALPASILVTAVSLQLGLAAQMFIALLLVLVIVAECVAPRRPRRLFWLGTGVLAVASLLSALDVTRTWCQPDNHWWQPHGAWHMLSALAMALVVVHVHATRETISQRRTRDAPPDRST